MTETKPNAELAYKVLDHIDADPRSWRQASWMTVTNCGTAYCFAGWAVRLSAGEVAFGDYGVVYVADGPSNIVDTPVEVAADIVLGIDSRHDGPQDLYDGLNTREDLGEIVAAIFGPRPGGAA